MKKLVLILFSCLLLAFASCKKDAKVPFVKQCETYTELKDKSNLKDPSVLGSEQLNTFLEAHPELQVYRLKSYEGGWTTFCNVFYQDLKVLTSSCIIHYNNNSGQMVSYDSLDFSGVNISLQPTLDYKEAIKIAREKVDFKGQCLNYRLCLFDRNYYSSNINKEYRLVWRVETENGLAYATIDATTGEVYETFDGVIWN